MKTPQQHDTSKLTLQTDLVFQLQVIVTPVPVPVPVSEQCSPLFICHKNAAYSEMS